MRLWADDFQIPLHRQAVPLQAILNPTVKYLSTTTIILLLLSCSTKSNKLDTKVQTIELHYITWACECANWATASDIEKYSDNVGDTLADLSMFIEPADSSIILPDTISYNGDIVRFTGQFYNDKGFPKNFKSDHRPDKARVFRYTKYQIIKSNYREAINDKDK